MKMQKLFFALPPSIFAKHELSLGRVVLLGLPHDEDFVSDLVGYVGLLVLVLVLAQRWHLLEPLSCYGWLCMFQAFLFVPLVKLSPLHSLLPLVCVSSLPA